MVTRRRASGSAKRFESGPWTSVLTTDDPFDGGTEQLQDARNVFFPDPQDKGGVYARPGFSLLNSGMQFTGLTAPFRTQGIFSFTDLSGATTNFVVMGGKLFRGDSTLAVFTDVTPVDVTIDSGVRTRVYGTTFITQLIVTDGVHRPWLLTNPTSTPVTGTYIDFDSMGTAWTAFGPFCAYGGSAFCILNTVNSVAARSDIAWSAPADASVGWQQTNYDFRWTLEQSTDGSNPPPLYALAGDNDALTYWRESSIGGLIGVPGPNLRGSATHDAISKNVGTLSPQSVIQYGTTKFFADALGRPYRLVPGNDPEPIWLQLRGLLPDTSIGFPGVTKIVCTAAFESTLNLYVIAPWSCIPAQQGPATEGYIFDARTGNYSGRFSIMGSNGDGVQLETLGTFIDVDGRGVLVAGGSAAAPSTSALATSGYLWGLNALVASGEFLTTEDAAPGLVFLTTEDGVLLTTEGSSNTGWTDNGNVPNISITTPRLGYAIDSVLSVDRLTALVNSGASVSVSVQTAAVAQTVEGIPTASTTQDAIGRLICGFDGIQGRGALVTLSPTTATEQFNAQQVSLLASVSNAPPDEA